MVWGGQLDNRKVGSLWGLMWERQHWVTFPTLGLAEVAQGEREVTRSSLQGSQCQTEGGVMCSRKLRRETFPIRIHPCPKIAWTPQ